MLGIVLALILGVTISIVLLAVIYHLKINFTKILFFIFILFLLSAFAVISINDIDITDSGWMTGFATAYVDWAKQVGDNIGEITGKIVSQDWVPR